MSAENLKNTDVSYFVKRVNRIIKSIEKSKTNLFDTFHSAYTTLSTDEFESKFITKINMDKSSINKMKKICKSDFIMNNTDKLPNSWATLYVLVNIDEDVLQQLIGDGDITTKTTKKQMLELRDNNNLPIVDEYEDLVDVTENDFIDGTEDNSVENRHNHWIGMPEFNNTGDDGSYRKLIIRFKEESDFSDFISKVDTLELTEKTKSVWYTK